MSEYSKKDSRKLLKLARASIKEKFSGKKPKFPEGKKLEEKRGVFVTLKENGKLRGCIGFPFPSHSIAEAIYLASKEAAFNDFRFSPVKKEELEKIKIEISILTLPQDCNCEEIKVGKDGLICNYLGYQGLLLPQVATENKMNKIEFLECLCNKAGLDKDKWKEKGFKLQKFSCEIFKE